MTEDRPQPRDEVDGWVVRYVGTSHLRKITRADWAAREIDHEEVAWRRDAPFNTVPLSKLHISPEDFDRLILADQDFQLEEKQH